jgi:hypothetical protein
MLVINAYRIDLGQLPAHLPRLNGHPIAPGAQPDWIKPGLASSEVEFPSVPRASEDLASSAPLILAGLACDDMPRGGSEAKRPACVRTPIEKRKVLIADAKDPDRPTFDVDNLPASVGDFADSRHGILAGSLSQGGTQHVRCRP